MIPIFIITCDRLEALKKSMQSYYDYIKTPFEVVIIDFGSSFGPMIDFLKKLENENMKIYWQDRISLKAELNSIDGIIQNYFESHPKSNYVVTDPDIALDNIEGNILDVYSYLLENIKQISVVGPMLRIDDIPDCYPKKEKLLSGGWHKDFHSRKINTILYEDKIIKYVFAPIDTTFGMIRAGKRWVRPMRGARVLAPYSARHLDWYLDPENLTEDQKYYMKHASRKITHWSNWSIK